MIIPGGRRRDTLSLPYAVPESAPYNAPLALVTPTYDGTGNTVHPDVVDFRLHGLAHWNGFRFWMAHTPFWISDYGRENPSLIASHDGVTWETPPGLTNPVYPAPAEYWNSDTDLSYNPDTGELAMIFRTYAEGIHQHMLARSTNGTTWSFTRLAGWSAPEESLSPAMVRMTDGTWALWGLGVGAGRTLRRWTAATPDGTWIGPTVCTGLPISSWHLDVCRIGSKLYMIIDEGAEGNRLNTYAASSVDGGLTWTRNPTPVITVGSGGWDDHDLYRATIQPQGQVMRTWYGGKESGNHSWRVGLTLIPLSEWP